MCSSWECMNQATQFGIVFSVIFTALTIIFLYWYLVLKQRQPPGSSEDVEVVEIEVPRPGRAGEGARLQWRNYEGHGTATRTPTNIFFFTQPQIIQPPKPRRQIEYRQAHEDELEDRHAHSEEDTEGQESPPPSRRRKPKKPKNPPPQPTKKVLPPPFAYHVDLPEHNLASPSTSAQPHQRRPSRTNYYWYSPPWTWQQQQQQQQQQLQQQAQPSHAARPYHHTGSYQPSQPQMMYWYQAAQQPANPHAPRAMPVSVQVPQVPQAFPQSVQQPVQSTPGQFAQPAQFTQTVQFTQPVQPTSIPQHTQPMRFAQQGRNGESKAAPSQQEFIGQRASSIRAPIVSPAMSGATRTNSNHTDQHVDEPVTRGVSWWRRLIWRLPVTGRASTLDGSSTSRSLSTEASPSRSPSPAPRRSRRRFRPQETRHRDRRRRRDSPAADERISGSLSSRSRSPSRVRARGPAANGSRKHPRRYSESLGGDIPVQPHSDRPYDRPSRRSSTPDFPDLSSLPSHTTLDSGEPPFSPSAEYGKNQGTSGRSYPERSGSNATDLRPQSHTQVTEPPKSAEIPQISVTPPQAAVARDHMGKRRPSGTDRRVSFDEDPVSQSQIIEEISETTESAPGISEQGELPDNAQRVKLHPRIPPVEPKVLYVEASPSEQGRAGLASEPTKSEAGSSTVVVAKADAGYDLAGANPEPGEDNISRSPNQAQHRDRHVRDRHQTSRASVGRQRRSDAASSESGEPYMPSPPKPFATQTFSGRTSISGRKFGRDSKLSVADSMEVQLSPDETVFPGHKIPPAKQRRGSEARERSSTTFYRFRGSEDDIQRN